MNYSVGITITNTMNVQRQINQHDVLVLIDGEAAHNFINSKVVKKKKIQLQVDDAKNFGVMISDRRTQGMEISHDVVSEDMALK